MKQFRLVLWALVLVAAIGAGWLATRAPAPAPLPASESKPVILGAPFTLTDQDGKRYSSTQLAGKPYALFAGFTHCPDVCPTTLARLAKLRREAGGDDKFAIVFLSVDPERDTPAELERYASLFDTPITMLTGTPAEIATVKKNFGLFSEKVPQPNGGYTVDHTATVMLFDREGRFMSTIAPDEGDPAALAKLKRLVG